MMSGILAPNLFLELRKTYHDGTPGWTDLSLPSIAFRIGTVSEVRPVRVISPFRYLHLILGLINKGYLFGLTGPR